MSSFEEAASAEAASAENTSALCVSDERKTTLPHPSQPNLFGGVQRQREHWRIRTHQRQRNANSKQQAQTDLQQPSVRIGRHISSDRAAAKTISARGVIKRA
eukprot:380586-Rhodomonas_salina.1